MKINFITVNKAPAIVSFSRDGKILSNLFNKTAISDAYNDQAKFLALYDLYRLYFKNTKRWKSVPIEFRVEQTKKAQVKLNIFFGYNIFTPYATYITDDPNYTAEVPEADKPKVNVYDIMNKLIRFFSEFEFEPNFRFVNTLCHVKDKQEYIKNYFALSDNAFYNSIVEKMKSDEFTSIISEVKKIQPTKVVNKHLEIYYGSQGTGKTTKANKIANNNCMVCHSAMLPSDMLEDFDFENGNATFKPSALYKAIEEGRTIVLDEINLLPWESVRFLQSILDGKESFIYKGKNIHIHDDFKVIGTMNLTVNGSKFALPEPLIDRACNLQKFSLTADMLVDAVI